MHAACHGDGCWLAIHVATSGSTSTFESRAQRSIVYLRKKATDCLRHIYPST